MSTPTNCREERKCTGCPSFALLEEIRQLKGLRRVRLKAFGPGDGELDHLDEMIQLRLVKLMAA